MTTITTPQLNYLTDLAVIIWKGQPGQLMTEIAGLSALTKAAASAKLDSWKPLAKAIEGQNAKAAPVAKVAEGWYLACGQNVKVKISKKGFPYLYSEAGDYIAGKSAEGAAMLAEIEADPKAASIAYGKATGSCGICSKTLTNPDSIAAGIGPVCAGKF